MPAPHILLVDDDHALLQAFTETVRYRLPDVQVDTCDSGFQALERVRMIDYHAIVSDFTMPGLSGLALLAEAKRERPCAPVLFMTGRLEEDLLAEAVKNGAYDFIRKPIDREQLLLAIKRALEASELRMFCEKQDALGLRLHQELRQLHQVMRPLLLSSLKALGRELGDERIEQSRSMIENAVALCGSQTRLIRRRLDFIEHFLEGTKRRLDSTSTQLTDREKESS